MEVNSFRFREWPVYKDARALRTEIQVKVLAKISKVEFYELGSQLRRAMTSIILNIAEGAFRKSDKDFSRFLNQAITSLYEVVACIDLALDDNFIDHAVHNELLIKLEKLAKQLNGFAQSLRS